MNYWNIQFYVTLFVTYHTWTISLFGNFASDETLHSILLVLLFFIGWHIMQDVGCVIDFIMNHGIVCIVIDTCNISFHISISATCTTELIPLIEAVVYQ